MPPEQAAGLLERAARAAPADVEASTHGWWLRHSDTWEWSAAAALAHRNVYAISQAIDAVEEFYRAHEAPACFQICAGCMSGLDDALAMRAYPASAPLSLEVGRAADVVAPRTRRRVDAEITGGPTDDWFSLGVSADRPHDVDRERARLNGVPLPSTYVTVYDSGQPIASGRAVVECGWAGVFDLITDPLHRGQGAARLVLSTLSRAAVDRGAQWLYLQVERGNDRARRLFRANGFREAATYHYRIQDTET